MSERQAFLVCYDICEPKRLRLTYRTMRGYGEHLQYSVFRCDLNDAELAKLKTALGRIIDQHADQILIVPLGPPGGRYANGMETIGTPLGLPPRRAVIV